MFHPLNYPTGTEYAKKTGPLFPPVKDCAIAIEN